MRPRCSATCKDGEPCRNSIWIDPDTGKEYQTCIFHVPPGDPAVDARRKVAATMGGKTRKKHVLEVANEERDLSSPADVSGVLAAAIRALTNGELSPRVATALATTAGALMKSQELEMLADRVAELEAELGGYED